MRVRRVATLLALGYGGAVGVMLVREPAFVFPGAALGAEEARRLPGPSLPWDSLRIESDDGVPLFLLVSESDAADPSLPWALFFHGNGGLVGSGGSVGRYRLFHEAGFNVLAVEFRGYGVSSGVAQPTEEGLYADARAAWRHLVESRGVDPARIVVYGWSLGSGPATYLAAEQSPAALVTEGAPTSLPDVGAESFPWIPVRLFMRNRFDNAERAAAVDIPWLVLHGRHDEVIPFHHGEALASIADGARLIPLDAAHNDGVLGDRDVALEELRALARSLVRSAAPAG
jgi:pimeloyl-ACP methyl ester carboxylesterase